MTPQAPDTLPPDFFDKPSGGGRGGQSASAPDTLPADFFDKPQAPPQKSATGFLANIFSSAGNLVGNAASTAMGAIEKPVRWASQAVTGQDVPPSTEERQFDNIGDTVAGLTHQGFKKVGLGSDADETPEAKSDIAKAEALENNYKQRYGGWQNIKDTAYNDPVGVLGDVAMLTGGVTGAAGKTAELADAANLPRAANTLRTVAKVSKVATQNNPIVSVPTKVIPGAYRAGKTAVGNYVDRVADPHTTMIQALRPTASRVGWDKSVKMAMPDIKAVETAPGAIKDVDSLLDAVAVAKKANRAQFEHFTSPAQKAGLQVDLNPVASAIENSVPDTVKFENSPGGVPSGPYKASLDHADLYRTSVSVDQAENFLRDTNAELDSYYAKYPGIKRAQLRANPETAALVAKADALRDALYKTLDSPGVGAGPRAINKRYGALIDIEDAAFRRKNVAARQAPQNLTEQFGNVHAAGHLVGGAVKAVTGNPLGAVADIAQGAAVRSTANWLKEQQSTNNLIRRAFKNYDGTPQPFPQPAPAVVAPVNPNLPAIIPGRTRTTILPTGPAGTPRPMPPVGSGAILQPPHPLGLPPASPRSVAAGVVNPHAQPVSLPAETPRGPNQQGGFPLSTSPSKIKNPYR